MSEKSGFRKSVLIASTFKTAKDTRAWGKLGLSLRETNKFKLNFIGFSPLKDYTEDGEKYFSSTSGRSTWGRIVTQFSFMKALISVRPQLLICCTYEYLPIASFFKKILKYKLIYDVQENYISNLALNPNLSPSKRAQFTHLIRRFESSSGIDLYLLAEKCYIQEMPEKSHYLVLENKFSGKIKPTKTITFSTEKKDFRFLISGTLTPAYGILDAVNWFKIILKKYPESSLQIIGHCTLESFQNELENACNFHPQIKLNSSSVPLPYEQILNAYQEVDFALLPYKNLSQLWPKMPTKLYEAAALGVPVLIPNNQKWISFLAPFNGGLPIDFSNAEDGVAQFDQALKHSYFSTSPDESLLWSSQHSCLVKTISSL